MTKETEKVPVKTDERRGGLWENALEPLTHLRDEMDRLFDDVTSGWRGGQRRRRGSGIMEPFRGMMEPFAGQPFGWGASVAVLDVVDNEKEIRIVAELPGLEESDIDVRLSDRLLTIHGEKKEEKAEGDEKSSFYVSERRYGSFQRSVRLPEGIDADKVEATFKNGLLTITVPKTPEAQAKARKIEVKPAT